MSVKRPPGVDRLVAQAVAQGLPEKVEDPTTIAKVSVILGGAPSKAVKRDRAA